VHDPDARPIVKGRLGKLVEFDCKAQIADIPTGSCSTMSSDFGREITEAVVEATAAFSRA